MPPQSIERIRKECNYAAWLCRHGLFNNLEACWDEADEILEELYPRAVKHLDPSDSHYFSVTQAWLLLKVVHHKVDPNEVIGAYSKMLESTVLIHGKESEQFHELTLEYATLLLRANRLEEAREQMRDYLSFEGEPNYTMGHKYQLQMIKTAIEALDPQVASQVDSQADMSAIFKKLLDVHDEHADENTVPGFWGDDEEDDKEEDTVNP